MQPYGYGSQAYPVLTVPLRPLQPIPVSGTTAGERRRAPAGNTHGDAVTGNQKARFATFHVSDPASLAARYGHTQSSAPGGAGNMGLQASRPETAHLASTPASGFAQASASVLPSRPLVEHNSPLSAMTTPITPILATPHLQSASNDIAGQGIQLASQSTSAPTLSELRAAAKQLEVLGTDSETKALEPARLQAVLEQRPELREAARLLITYGHLLA